MWLMMGNIRYSGIEDLKSLYRKAEHRRDKMNLRYHERQRKMSKTYKRQSCKFTTIFILWF